MIRPDNRSDCRTCAHYKGIKQPFGDESLEYGHCKAFERIPDAIFLGQEKHRESIKGDSGIVFKPRERIDGK